MLNYKKEFDKKFAQTFENHFWKNIIDLKPRTLTKKEKEVNKLAVIKEEERRAKKITMTVGEYEDELEARSNYDYY